MAVYVHVPFCDSRCRYCDFYLETGWSPKVIDRFADTLLAEARLAAETLLAPGTNLKTLYFGGGTPSVLPVEVVARISEGLRQVFPGQPAEFTFEANPESVTPAYLQALARAGVDRLSLGVQTLDEGQLKTLGRRAGVREVEASLEALRQVWTARWNVDVITGLPGQTAASLSADLDRLLACGPDHVSLYSLGVEKQTALHELVRRREVLLPPEEAAEDLWFLAAHRLETAGLNAYEVSNFARPGAESRHNRQYWTLQPWFGLGPGAHSMLPTARGPTRLVNPHLFAWLSAAGQPEREIEVLSVPDLIFEHFLTGLRTAEGLTPQRLQALFPGPWLDHLEPLRQSWLAKGWLQPGPAWMVPPVHRQILNPLLVEIKTALDQARAALPELGDIHWPLAENS